MLNVSRARVANLAPTVVERVQLAESDVAGFDSEAHFGLAIFSGNTLSCLVTDTEPRKALVNVHGLLRRSGKLLIVQMSPQHWTQQVQEGRQMEDWTVVPETGVLFRLTATHRFDRRARLISSEFRMEIRCLDGSRETRSAAQVERVMYHDDIIELMEICRYRVINEYGEYDRKPYREGDRLIIVLGEKIL